jgi:hypothetical protein
MAKQRQIDWHAIRAEYVTSNVSLGDLCEKYHVSKSPMYRRSSRENWVEERQRYEQKKAESYAKQATKQAVKQETDYRQKFYDLGALILGQIEDMCKTHTVKELADMKIRPRDITGAVRDLEEVMHIRTEADLQEQKARIENLKRQADQGSRDETVIVRFADGDEDLAK